MFSLNYVSDQPGPTERSWMEACSNATVDLAVPEVLVDPASDSREMWCMVRLDMSKRGVLVPAALRGEDDPDAANPCSELVLALLLAHGWKLARMRL